MENAYTNYYSILNGEYDLEKVQEFERPFYEQLQRRCDPIEAMGRPMTYYEDYSIVRYSAGVCTSVRTYVRTYVLTLERGDGLAISFTATVSTHVEGDA